MKMTKGCHATMRLTTLLGLCIVRAFVEDNIDVYLPSFMFLTYVALYEKNGNWLFDALMGALSV